ncbi:TPA: hypothetical protein RQO46_004991 [Klebsiella oxytoca]|nr:hypothetical protein [Klebsiella oxytoca]
MTMVNNPAVLSGLSARSVAIHLSHLFAQKRLIPSVHQSGSGNLNRFLKAISWDELMLTGIKIIRPPLHHLSPFVEVFRFVNIRGANVIVLLMAHLPLHSIF